MKNSYVRIYLLYYRKIKTVKEASKKSIVNKNSEKCYVLGDSSKFNKSSLCKAFEFNECIIITDKKDVELNKHATFLIAE